MFSRQPTANCCCNWTLALLVAFGLLSWSLVCHILSLVGFICMDDVLDSHPECLGNEGANFRLVFASMSRFTGNVSCVAVAVVLCIFVVMALVEPGHPRSLHAALHLRQLRICHTLCYLGRAGDAVYVDGGRHAFGGGKRV